MTTMGTNSFDAVAESRRWKEAVARQTAGLKREEVIAFFDKESLLTVLQNMREADPPVSRVREEPPNA